MLICPIENIFKNDIFEGNRYIFLHLVQPERRWACAPFSLQGLDSRGAPVLDGKPNIGVRSSTRQFSRFQEKVMTVGKRRRGIRVRTDLGLTNCKVPVE